MPMQALGAPPPDLAPEYSYPPPVRRPEPPKGRVPRGKALDYGLKGLGLLGVALVSGLLWFLIRNNPAPAGQALAPPPSQSGGVYQFQPYHGATTDPDCAAQSTDRVKLFLQQHSCVSLTRSLYTAALPDSEKVITSVVVVRMDSAADASALRILSDGNGTGHVKDLVEAGVVIPGGPSDLQEGGYFSVVRGSRVVVVMTEYVDGSQDNTANLSSSNQALRAVSQDAAKQGIGVNNG
jgi:hypothetical protein